jgi:hypothetical protein
MAWAMISSCANLQTEQVSVNAGDEYFHRRAIGSPYATGIPYALWLALMNRFPKELGLNWTEFTDKFGLISNASDPRGLPVGFVLEHDSLSGTPFLMTNCSLCHTAMINNRKVDGLGARDLKLTELNNVFMRLVGRNDFNSDTMIPLVEAIAHRNNIPWDWRSNLAAKMAIEKLKELSAGHKDIDAGPGRSVPIEFMKEVAHLPIDPPYGYVRFRPMWSYSKRKSFGADGAVTGDTALAAALVEYNKRMPPNDIVNYKNRFYSIYDDLKTLHSPRYPGLIDKGLAERGRKLYSDHCAGCHGSDNKETYVERVIPLAEVKADPDRLHALSQQLITSFNQNEFGMLSPVRNTGGYIARPLDGIWSCGPYLHNGSVPSLHDLLRPAVERPVIFYLGGDTDYDLKKLGVHTLTENPMNNTKSVHHGASSPSMFDTRSPGNSNKGHDFGTKLSEPDRQALIEYLKLW